MYLFIFLVIFPLSCPYFGLLFAFLLELSKVGKSNGFPVVSGLGVAIPGGGGGFGGGSFEGNGFGATADQAIRNSCFWGQRTPIEIGVARGANGYYATIFYR